MKKLLGLVVALLLLVGSFASAEEFTLRNGIAFGDTMDEVLEKETFAIDEVVDSIEEEEEESEGSEDESEELLPYSIKTERSTLAGIDDSYIIYSFDKDKTLQEVEYVFRSSKNENMINTDYEAINKSLISKYGNPLGYTNGDCYVFTGQALQEFAMHLALIQYINGLGDYVDYDEWDVDTGDYHIKIEQVEYYHGASYKDISYVHILSYTYFTDEQLAEKLDEKQADQEAMDEDL